MSKSETAHASSTSPAIPATSHQFLPLNEAQYDVSNGRQPSAASAYYPPDNHHAQSQHAAQLSAMAFDLNAVGDEDEEVDGQMHQIYKEGSEGNETSEADQVDRRSVFVGNVDYGATPPELQEHFKNCGAINRITIMVDRYSGHPKGYAYIEFQDEAAIPNAVALTDSVFRDRQLKVTAKRKNVPGLSARGRGGGGGMMGRGRGSRGGIRGGKRGAMGYLPRYRGRGGRAGAFPY